MLSRAVKHFCKGKTDLPARANTFIFVSRGVGLAGLIVTSDVIGYSPFPEDSIGCLL